MRITKNYLGKIIKSREFNSRLKDAGQFTLNTDKEAGFIVVKEPGKKGYEVSKIIKGDYFSLFNINYSEDKFDIGKGSILDITTRLEGYPIFPIHFHPGEYGPIVPSLEFDDTYGCPNGDLDFLRNERAFFRKMLGYDIRPIMGVAKIRNPTQTDVLFLQEKTENPAGFGHLAQVEETLKYFFESERRLSPEESYQACLQVTEALRNTGFYTAELVRFKNGRPLPEDLERLVNFEFEEVKLPTRPNQDLKTFPAFF